MTHEDQAAVPALNPTTPDDEPPTEAEQPDGEQSDDEQPDGEQSDDEQPDGEQSDDERPSTVRPGLVQRFGVPTIALTVTTAIFLVFGVVMTGLYVYESNVRADRDGQLTAKTAEVEAARAELERAMADSADLRAKLKAAEDKILDPKGYELIKSCVQTHATMERALLEAVANGGGSIVYREVSPDALANWVKPSDVATGCMEAEKYLK